MSWKIPKKKPSYPPIFTSLVFSKKNFWFFFRFFSRIRNHRKNQRDRWGTGPRHHKQRKGKIMNLHAALHAAPNVLQDIQWPLSPHSTHPKGLCSWTPFEGTRFFLKKLSFRAFKTTHFQSCLSLKDSRSPTWRPVLVPKMKWEVLNFNYNFLRLMNWSKIEWILFTIKVNSNTICVEDPRSQ